MSGSLLARAREALLDASVVRSFDRSGFQRHARDFRPQDLRVDLSDKTCLITGGNAGLGREAARGLAERGATVWLLCRDLDRGRAAAVALRHETGNPRVQVERIDLASLQDVREAVARLSPARVDVLIHNAGVLPRERVLTPDGLELTVATHVACPFLLTLLLRPRLRAAEGARVIFVSSGGMYARRLDVAALERSEGPYDGVAAYARTKRAQVVLAELLAERLAEDGVLVSSMHPGWADTGGVRRSLPRFYRLTRDRLRTPAEGADTMVWLAACPDLAGETGRFWFDRAPRRTHLLPWTRETAEEREALWALCVRWATRSAPPPASRPTPSSRAEASVVLPDSEPRHWREP